ncbi:hypothetical protein J2Z40_000836 [Cytobacillus eiseniae]|uniref:Glycosyltransferase 2-like domain-containing protein n=1 Tax=Cytobacillus eiseniae TaxID=762947 RepID=A0ABS4RBK1_9BACI|nr:glycosyltransferase [Cytobacillus eiseniae]MBP2240283.1 hypothetical protein [Cytobacillus eiseniae]
MNKRIIINIKFNNWDSQEIGDERLSKQWIEDRMEIFVKFTLQSLMQQTSQDFLTLILYEDSTEELIANTLRKYEKLPNNIKFIKKTAYVKEVNQYIDGYQYFYLTRIDSDDMFHQTFIEQLHQYKPKASTVALINQKGYIYDSVYHRLATWYYFSPPFYTFIYKTNEWLDGKRYSVIGGHKSVISYPHEILGEGKFVVVVHSNNIHSKFNSPYKQETIADMEQINEILSGFNKRVIRANE